VDSSASLNLQEYRKGDQRNGLWVMVELWYRDRGVVLGLASERNRRVQRGLGSIRVTCVEAEISSARLNRLAIIMLVRKGASWQCGAQKHSMSVWADTNFARDCTIPF
jgi:hypothetical protein